MDETPVYINMMNSRTISFNTRFTAVGYIPIYTKMSQFDSYMKNEVF